MWLFQMLQRNMQAVAGIGLGTVFGISCVPQTLGLDKYRETLAQYQDGYEKKLSENMYNLSQKVLTHILLPSKAESVLEIFSAYGVDMIHKGSLKLRTGAIVGIPPIMDYDKTDDVQTGLIRAGGRSLDWESPAGRSFQESLVFSREAKAFAIAREVYYAHTHHVTIDASMRGLFGAMAYLTGFALNRVLQLQLRMKLWGRTGVYAMIGGFYLPLYLLAIDTYMCHRDNKVDRWTAQLGLAYAQGGEEYYTKLLQRNIALRTLLGPEAPTTFTVYGNQVESLRRRHEALTKRKEYMQDYIRQYEDKTDLGFGV